ncbi:hypothetical protein [Trichoplusia ni ascovirus 6b]|nr:hypothetical protein [Trichoplusia ni ascovirus 6b]
MNIIEVAEEDTTITKIINENNDNTIHSPSHHDDDDHNETIAVINGSDELLFTDENVNVIFEGDVCKVLIWYNKRPEPKKSFLKKCTQRIGTSIVGGIWGGFEGMASGTLIGVSVTGAGWWIAGSVCQLIGSVTGFTFGTVTGAIMGLMSDKNNAAKVIADYRRAFGIIDVKLPLR